MNRAFSDEVEPGCGTFYLRGEWPIDMVCTQRLMNPVRFLMALKNFLGVMGRDTSRLQLMFETMKWVVIWIRLLWRNVCQVVDPV